MIIIQFIKCNTKSIKIFDETNKNFLLHFVLKNVLDNMT